MEAIPDGLWGIASAIKTSTPPRKSSGKDPVFMAALAKEMKKLLIEDP